MIINNKFSIVVQGLFDNYIYDRFNYPEHYIKYVDKVIISCYTNDDTSILEKNIAGNDRIVLVKNDCPTFHCNPCNMYVHAFSTLKGLEKVETEFTIKIRSNQFYTQIDKIITLVENNPSRYTVSNINTQNPYRYAYKVSDHLFAGKTEGLKFAMQQTLKWCHEANNTVDKHGHLGHPETGSYGQTEHVFFLAFLKYLGYNLSDILNISNQEKAKIMKDNLVIFHIDELKPYLWSCHPNSGQIVYKDDFIYTDCISSTDEIIC